MPLLVCVLTIQCSVGLLPVSYDTHCLVTYQLSVSGNTFRLHQHCGTYQGSAVGCELTCLDNVCVLYLGEACHACGLSYCDIPFASDFVYHRLHISYLEQGTTLDFGHDVGHTCYIRASYPRLELAACSLLRAHSRPLFDDRARGSLSFAGT